MQQQFNPDNSLSQVDFDKLMFHLTEALGLLKRYSVSLTPDERRGNRSVGRRREAYVRQALRAAKAHEQILPRNLDVNRFERMLASFEQHKDMQVILSEIAELGDDTQLAIGRELMTETDIIYGAFKLARYRDASLDRVFGELENFNIRTSQEDEDDKAKKGDDKTKKADDKTKKTEDKPTEEE